MNRFWLLLFFFFSLASAAPHAPGSAVQWRSYEAALQEAAKKEKLVLLSLHAAWCPACKVMSQTTWKDKGVARMIESTVVPVELDIESTKPLLECGDQKLAVGACASSYWGVEGLPAVILLDSKGEYLFHQAGYFDAEMMLSFLQIVQQETPQILKEVQAYRDSLEKIGR